MDAGLAGRVRSLADDDMGGRGPAIKLLRRAVEVAERRPEELAGDIGVREALAAVVENPAAIRSLRNIRDEVMQPNDTARMPAAVLNPAIRSGSGAVTALVQIFRTAAPEFRAARPADASHDDFLSDLQRTRRVGQALIDARVRGLIPDSHPELTEVIDHHRSGGREESGRTLGPINLWEDVRGGHLAPMHGPIGERRGGLLPGWVGNAVLHMSAADRSAAACEYIADLMDGVSNQTSSSEGAKVAAGAATPPAPTIGLVARCGSRLHCSPDCSTVFRGDQQFTFTDTQRLVIDYMIRTYETRPRIFSYKELLQVSGSVSDDFRNVFKAGSNMNTAWGVLILPVKGSKGRCELCPG